MNCVFFHLYQTDTLRISSVTVSFLHDHLAGDNLHYVTWVEGLENMIYAHKTLFILVNEFLFPDEQKSTILISMNKAYD